jgi:PASTA domain
MRRGAILTFTAITAVLLLTGCSGPSEPAPETAPVQVPGVATPAASAAQKIVILPDVVGQNGAIAQDTLRGLGLTKVDLAADASSGKQIVLLPENWTVTKMEPKAGTEVHTDQTVVVTMTK